MKAMHRRLAQVAEQAHRAQMRPDRPAVTITDEDRQRRLQELADHCKRQGHPMPENLQTYLAPSAN